MLAASETKIGGLIGELMAAINVMPPADIEKTKKLVDEGTKGMRWLPNPGPQVEGFYCPADELFYGGQAGGGKTALLCGLALTAHKRSLILRRTNKEAEGLADEFEGIIGDREGYNSQRGVWRIDGRVIDLGGCQLEVDKQKYKGRPHDFIGFDEIGDFTLSQYTFICAWNRSTEPGQRCRIVATGNPPTEAEGMWVLERWAAWLDPNHHNPAAPGELRWYTTGELGKEIEVEGPGPHLIGGEEVMARSRTFIPAKLSDNPDLVVTDYAATLAALPEAYRAAYRDGNFRAALKDNPFQAILTSHVRAAQQRWTPHPPPGVPMCSMGVDVAQGGSDETIIACRHDGWFADLIAKPGKETPDGSSVAGLVVAKRRDNAVVVIDMGGGYGGAALQRLTDNGVEAVAYKGAERANGRTQDRTLAFVNKRSQAYWRFREALDPSQAGGSPIALPDDPALVADLTAPTFKIGPNGIEIEAKEKVVARLGRSTDRGDAVVMAWSAGIKGENVRGGFTRDYALRKRQPVVNMGHMAARRMGARV